MDGPWRPPPSLDHVSQLEHLTTKLWASSMLATQGAVEVDIVLFELRDYGVTADIDRYRGHMKEYEALLEEKRLLEKRLSAWRSRAHSPCQQLIKAQA
jgi:hypothetical protein